MKLQWILDKCEWCQGQCTKTWLQLVLHGAFSMGVNWRNCTRSSVLIVQSTCGTVCELLNTCLVSLQKLLPVMCWYRDDGRWSYDFRNIQAILSKRDFCLLLSPKHLLIVDWADFFAEAKFWLIKVCVSELGWSWVKFNPKEHCRVDHMLFISWESQSVLQSFVVADPENLNSLLVLPLAEWSTFSHILSLMCK